ncbi:MAG: response regulator [Chloroflexi bacterium]|nr:response regulator [Chloroflexota bacterium]
MTAAEFTQHIRFALYHLFEISVLDKGPARILAPWLRQVCDPLEQASPGQQLHLLLVRAIERLKPAQPLDANLPRHRTYLILKRRYLDGIPIQQLESEFNSSSRQFRRDSHRAVEELALILWNQAPQEAQAAIIDTARREASDRLGALADFDRSVSPINLLDLVVDAAQTLSVIISATHTQVIANIATDLPPVAADRVALRLALIKLLRTAIAHSPGHVLKLHATIHQDTMTLIVDGVQGLEPADTAFAEAAQLFALADGALELDAAPIQSNHPDGPARAARIIATLATHYRPTVLVIDDDPAMSRIIQRFLALKPIKVVSCNSTDNVLKVARETQPILILLDVLMPKRDGWEVLQELKANPDTYHINLAVCSIWDERELALSLGADLFFQKPIGRSELLECIEKHIPIDAQMSDFREKSDIT